MPQSVPPRRRSRSTRHRYVTSRALTDSEITQLEAGIAETLDETHGASLIRRRQLEQQLAKLDQQESNLLDLAADGTSAAAKVRARLHDIDRKRACLQADLAPAEIDSPAERPTSASPLNSSTTSTASTAVPAITPPPAQSMHLGTTLHRQRSRRRHPQRTVQHHRRPRRTDPPPPANSRQPKRWRLLTRIQPGPTGTQSPT